MAHHRWSAAAGEGAGVAGHGAGGSNRRGDHAPSSPTHATTAPAPGTPWSGSPSTPWTPTSACEPWRPTPRRGQRRRVDPPPPAAQLARGPRRPPARPTGAGRPRRRSRPPPGSPGPAVLGGKWWKSALRRKRCHAARAAGRRPVSRTRTTCKAPAHALDGQPRRRTGRGRDGASTHAVRVAGLAGPGRSLEWNCWTTAAHVAHDLLAYAGQVAAQPGSAYLPFDVVIHPDATPRDVLQVVTPAEGSWAARWPRPGPTLAPGTGGRLTQAASQRWESTRPWCIPMTSRRVSGSAGFPPNRSAPRCWPGCSPTLRKVTRSRCCCGLPGERSSKTDLRSRPGSRRLRSIEAPLPGGRARCGDAGSTSCRRDQLAQDADPLPDLARGHVAEPDDQRGRQRRRGEPRRRA